MVLYNKKANHLVLLVLTRQRCRLSICCYIGWMDIYWLTNTVFVNSTNITSNIETAALSIWSVIFISISNLLTKTDRFLKNKRYQQNWKLSSSGKVSISVNHLICVRYCLRFQRSDWYRMAKYVWALQLLSVIPDLIWFKIQIQKGAGTTHSAGQSEGGNLVMALPSIRFSWNFYQVSNKNRFLGSEAPPPNPSLSIWLDSGTNKLLKFVPFKWWESYLNIQFNQIIQMRRIESK